MTEMVLTGSVNISLHHQVKCSCAGCLYVLGGDIHQYPFLQWKDNNKCSHFHNVFEIEDDMKDDAV